MRIKGRLRSISYLEWFVIVTVLFIAIFTVKFFGIKKEYLTIKVEVIRNNWTENYDPYGYRVPFWISDKVKIGQVEKDKLGRTIAIVTDLENYERGNEEAELYLTLKVKVNLNKKTGTYTFKNKPLNLGSEIELALDNIDLKGQIIDNKIPTDGYPTKYFMIKVRGRNVEQWLCDEIVAGLTVKNRVNGEVIAEIVDTKTEKSTLQQVYYNGGYLNTAPDSNKDLVIDIKVKAYQMDGRWYSLGHQNLKINNAIYLYTNKININGFEIKEIKELDRK